MLQVEPETTFITQAAVLLGSELCANEPVIGYSTDCHP